MDSCETIRIIKSFYNSIFTNYRKNKSEEMNSSDFVFHYIDKLYYSCYKTNLNCRGFFVGSLEWLKKRKKTPKNPEKEDQKKIYYAVTVVLAMKNFLP